MQLSVQDVARVLKVSEKTVYRWIGEGSIPFHKVDGTYRFNRTELLEWANARNLKVGTEIYRKEESGHPMPSVAEAIEAGGVVYALKGDDKAAALRSMIEALPLPDTTDREMLYELVLAREALGSTAVGRGIAIPHVRNPLVFAGTSPRITLCFLEKAIDFDAPDRQPVGTLFWLVTPTVRAHTHMLARLASVVRDPAYQAALDRRAPREEILAETRRIEASLGPASGTENKAAS